MTKADIHARTGIPVNMMNVRGLADLKKKKSSKVPKGTDAGVPKPASDFIKKPEGPSAVPSADAAAAAKRKAAGKAPEGKMPKAGDAGKKDPPVVIVDDCPASGMPVEMSVVEVPRGVQEPSSEVLMVSLPVGTAVMNCTADPRVLLRGMTPEIDRVALGADDDLALEDKILWSSLTTCIALGEQARRLEEWRLRKAEHDAKMRELICQNSDAIRQMAMLEESLRQMTLWAEAADRGKAEAERSAAEALERAAKADAIAKAREDAVFGFLAGGGEQRSINNGCPRSWSPSSTNGVTGPMWNGFPERANNTMMGVSFLLKPSSTGGWPVI
ncbi:unnamed protein product [Cuscuta europaea]|uniref:Uncharacterized protein n=1 Tax=Cuscuta europaea TaxID=41803 RepID=A0A9P0YVF6_CUSEU|nr:unnamed protein product [Cuscuta europaea]